MTSTAWTRFVRAALAAGALAASAAAFAQSSPLQPQPPLAAGTLAVCSATWYGAEGEIPEGWPTASGEPFHRFALAAAHNSLPFGTQVRVSYQGRSVVVRINDRGGFGWPICIDLTYGAFLQIAHPDQGVVSVDYQVL
ncbi:septal ring lytic transglycosylase RlpA family protein [Lysobacter enzymogenes]|uniref:septal ring lytic transglycosylase RlpA family protein n=1 Tax=Lysobacter enzymogenes TaxID=69 RepID=UPI000899AFBE|nr:septal ring lytic transglycosylase RlpA family protein [Lysobacter enzymogenes]SDX74519.1 rare lipoprotein A [Lysobacter enzymogenes]